MTLYGLIDWLGFYAVLTISQLYHGGQFTYSCISWFPHTSTPYNNLPKQLAAFPHRLSPLVEDEWRMSHWLLFIVGKKVGRAGIRTHNPWIDSPRRYWLSYRGSADYIWKISFVIFHQEFDYVLSLEKFSLWHVCQIKACSISVCTRRTLLKVLSDPSLWDQFSSS